MKKEIFQEIEIPEGVEAIMEGNQLIVRGPEGEQKKEFKVSNLVFEKKENKIIIGSKKARKTEKKMINTITAHIKNMLWGVKEKFSYKLKICFQHFPMTVEIKGNKAIIKNFLGEKVPREVRILEGAEVEIGKEFITITSINKEVAGQTAANFEKATKVGQKDPRVFQDGIYIINKNGKEI